MAAIVSDVKTHSKAPRVLLAWVSLGALVLPTAGAAQTPPPGRAPVVGPRALGGQSLYRVVSTTQTPIGSDSSEHVLRIRWKAGQVLTLSLGTAGSTAAAAEYVVPRSGDGSFAPERVTPQDPGLQGLCAPLEALGDLFKALAGAQGANAWSSTVTVGLAGTGSPATGCAAGSTQGLTVALELTRSVAADGSAILIGSGTTTQQQAAPQGAAGGETRQRRGGFGGLGGGFPIGGQRGGEPPGGLARGGGALTTAVSLSARLASDGTLTEMTLTKTLSFSFGSRAVTLNRSVNIDKLQSN